MDKSGFEPEASPLQAGRYTRFNYSPNNLYFFYFNNANSQIRTDEPQGPTVFKTARLPFALLAKNNECITRYSYKFLFVKHCLLLPIRPFLASPSTLRFGFEPKRVIVSQISNLLLCHIEPS